MVSNLSIFYMYLAMAIALLFPLLVAVYFYRREGISFKPLFIGILSFTITQILVRIPMLTFLNTKEWFIGFQKSSPLAMSLLLALSAGLFEEAGRVYGFKWFLKDRMAWKDGIAFGIGHGGIESIYVGLSGINNIIMSKAINTGTFDSLVAKGLPAEMAASLKEQLITLSPSTFLAGGLERVFALFIQIGLTLLALYGIRTKQHKYSIFAILIHTLIDFPLPFMLETLGIWGSEIIIALIGLLALFLSVKAKEWYENPKIGSREKYTPKGY